MSISFFHSVLPVFLFDFPICFPIPIRGVFPEEKLPSSANEIFPKKERPSPGPESEESAWRG